jgi:hypothetical protein
MSIKFIFDGFENDRVPFSNTIRTLLVDSILNNLSFVSKNKPELKDLKKGNFQKVMETQLNLENKNDQNDKDPEYGVFKKDFLKTQQGLPFMLNQNYFDDAFCLHDRTNFYPHLEKMLINMKKTEVDYYSPSIAGVFMKDKNEGQISEDKRKNLQSKWASFRNIYKFQPFNLIRDYFGEAFALYFVWLGTFNNSLIFPTLVGLIFFFVGISNRFF